MAIALDEASGACVIVPRGSLVGEEAEALRRRLGEALAAGAVHVVVDLRPVQYLSARALGVLVAHLLELTDRGGTLKLLGCSQHLRGLFELCGLDHLFEFIQPPDPDHQDNPDGGNENG